MGEAREAKAAQPAAMPLWGGTDVMVDMNFGRARPEAILDLTRLTKLTEHDRDDGMLRVGAGVSYTRAIAELGHVPPGLAIASRTVGSPQIRNRGTIGGNLGSSSRAGGALPPLCASGAEESRTVGTCLGSAAPTPRRAHQAERFINGAVYRRHALALMARRTLKWAWA